MTVPGHDDHHAVATGEPPPRDITPFSIGRFEIRADVTPPRAGKAARAPASRPGRTSPFLRGPIPLEALSAAALLPGRALHVFIAVHHQTALTGSPTVTLSRGLLTKFGVDRDAKSRALHALEEAGLIKVRREQGKQARVTLL